MIFKKTKGEQFKNFSITLLKRNDINNFSNTDNWFLENIIQIDKLYINEFNLRLDDIDINFGNYQSSSIENTLKKMKQKNLSFFSAQAKKIDKILILYDNPFLNQLDLNSNNVNLDAWDYGYGMGLLENQTLDGSKIKSTIFSNENIPLFAEKIWDNMLLTNGSLAEKGFVKDIYELNILNHKQAENINLTSFLNRGIGSYSIKNEKYIWTLNFTEIDLVKSALSSAPFLLSMRKE